MQNEYYMKLQEILKVNKTGKIGGKTVKKKKPNRTNKNIT